METNSDIKEIKVMTKEEILKMLQEQPELKTDLLNGLMDSATVETLVSSGNKELQALIDKSVTKGIETFKQKGMLSILEAKKSEYYDEFAKENGIELNPRIKEMEKQIRELRDHNAKIERENLINAKKSDITSKMVEKGLNPSLVNFLHLEKEDVEKDVETLVGIVETLVNEKVKFKLKEKDTNPGSTTTVTTGKNPYSKESWNLTEQGKLEESDPETAKQLREQAKI